MAERDILKYSKVKRWQEMYSDLDNVLSNYSNRNAPQSYSVSVSESQLQGEESVHTYGGGCLDRYSTQNKTCLVLIVKFSYYLT